MLRFFVVLAGLLMLLPLLMKFVLHVIVPRTVPVGVLLLLPAGLMRFMPNGACSPCCLLCCCRAVALMLPVAVPCCSSYRSAFHERRLRMNPCPRGSSGQETARGRRRQAARGAQGPRVNVRARQHPVAADDPVRGLRLLGHLLRLQGIKESLFLRCGKASHRPGREVPGVRPPSTAWKKVSCHLGERKATWVATSASAAAACAAWCAALRRASRRHPIAARARARRRSSVRAVWSGWIRTATAAARTLSLCSPLPHGYDGVPTPYIMLCKVQQPKYALPL